MENFNLGDGMLKQMTSIVAALFLFLGSSLQAQLAEPTNMVVMDKYTGTDLAVFSTYFTMLQDRYEGRTGPASGWGIYYESPTVMYRLAAVPEGGMEGVLELQQDRVTSANAFSESDRNLWETAWEGRETSIWAELGGLNYMPNNFEMNYRTVSGNPYHSIRVYYVKQGEQLNFERAIERMNELNRSVGINDLGLRVFRGGWGTMAPVYMFRSSSEDMEDAAKKFAAHNAARESILPEWQENNRHMTAMSRSVDQGMNFRVADLSRSGTPR